MILTKRVVAPYQAGSHGNYWMFASISACPAIVDRFRNHVEFGGEWRQQNCCTCRHALPVRTPWGDRPEGVRALLCVDPAVCECFQQIPRVPHNYCCDRWTRARVKPWPGLPV